MKKQYKFIFDLDGTLYAFDKGKGRAFDGSRFYTDLRSNICSFFMERRGLSQKEAIVEYERINEKYRGEVSLGVVNEYGIDRYDFFDSTWNLDPEGYIEKDVNLSKSLKPLRDRIAVLTNAPRIWAAKALAYLEIENVFKGKLYTGEPDDRKPNPIVFQRIAGDLGVPTRNVFSIGDQELTDIVPAKSIGMKTILIGRSQDSVADFQAPDVKAAISLLRREGFV